MDLPPADPPLPSRRSGGDSGPIFSDPSGQRRRLIRVVGVAGCIFLAGALVMVGLGLFGGPNSPLSVFGPPHTSHSHKPGGAGQRAPSHAAPGQAGSSVSHAATPTPRALRSVSASGSASPSPSPSPTPTNKAGKTPRGHSNTPSPHPHPSPSSTHAR